MEFTLKAKVPENKPSFIVGEIMLKVKSFADLEKSIENNGGYLRLSIKTGDNGHYLQINDYYKYKKK